MHEGVGCSKHNLGNIEGVRISMKSIKTLAIDAISYI